MMYTLEYYTYHLRAYGYRPRYRPSPGRKSLGLSASPRSAALTGPKDVEVATEVWSHMTLAAAIRANRSKAAVGSREAATSVLTFNLTATSPGGHR